MPQRFIWLSMWSETTWKSYFGTLQHKAHWKHLAPCYTEINTLAGVSVWSLSLWHSHVNCVNNPMFSLCWGLGGDGFNGWRKFIWMNECSKETRKCVFSCKTSLCSLRSESRERSLCGQNGRRWTVFHGDQLKKRKQKVIFWPSWGHVSPACILAVVSSKRCSRHVSFNVENQTISEVLFVK